MPRIIINLTDAQATCLTESFGSPEAIFAKVVSDCVNECARKEAEAALNVPVVDESSVSVSRQ